MVDDPLVNISFTVHQNDHNKRLVKVRISAKAVVYYNFLNRMDIEKNEL